MDRIIVNATETNKVKVKKTIELWTAKLEKFLNSM